MNKGLFIKEIKEKWLVEALGAVLCLLPPALTALAAMTGAGSGKFLKDFAFAVAGLGLGVVTFIFPVLLASSSVAGEIEKKTLTFLLAMPVSRLRLWLTKLAAAVVLQYGLIGAYVLINFRSLGFERANTADSGQAWLFLLLLLPFFNLALVFFSSTLFDKESTAAGAFILFLFVISFALGAFMKGTSWEMSTGEVACVYLLMAGGLLYCSYRMFRDGELAGHRVKRLRSLGVGLAVCLVPAAAVLGALYWNFGALRLSDIRNVSPLAVKNGNTIVAAVYRGGGLGQALCEFSVRPWKPLRKIAENATQMQMSPGGERMAYLRRLDPRSALGKLLAMESIELWTADGDGRNAAKVKDLPSPAFPVFLQWMSGGGRLLLASCLTPASLGVPVTNLTFVDPRGKITRDVDIPADKDADPRCNGVEIVKDDIYLLYGIYNPLYGGKNVHAGRIAVKKYREQDGTAETVFLRETAVPGRELFLPYYESVYPLAECNALDPRGGHLVYFVTHPDGKLDYVLVDLSDRTERVIATNEDSNLFFRWVKWLKGGKELMVTVADKGRVLLRIFDTKSGRAVADIPQKHHVFQHVSISPDGKKMAYLCYDKKAWNMVRIYDLEGRKPVTEIEAQGHLFSLTWLDGGRVLGVGKEKVYLFDTAGGAEVLHENPGR